MFDMGFTEVLLIGIVALVVIGPERLPGVAVTVGKYVGRMKRFVSSVRADVENEFKTDEIRKLLAAQQEELSSLKNVMNEASKGLDISDVATSIGESVIGSPDKKEESGLSESEITATDQSDDQIEVAKPQKDEDGSTTSEPSDSATNKKSTAS